MSYTFVSPFNYFNNPANSNPVGLGKLYIGLPELDPKIEANQVQLYVVQGCGCEDLAVSQPINLSAGGVPVYNGSPVQLKFNETEVAVRVDSMNGTQQYYTSRYSPPISADAIDGFDNSQSVTCIKALQLVTEPVEGIQYDVIGFYEDTTIGGGPFVYDATRSYADHNGGTVIAAGALAVFNGTTATLAAFLNYSGSGVGCWVRLGLVDFLSLEMFGALGDDLQDSRLITQSAIEAASSHSISTVKCPRQYFLEGRDRIIVPSNIFIDMCNTGSFRKSALVNAANFYAYSYFHFENSSNSGVINGQLNGINSTIANSNDTTGATISVGGGCDNLLFDQLQFNESWTGLLIGTNLSASNFSKNIKIGFIHGIDCEQTAVASAVKGLQIDTLKATKVSSKITQRGLFLQNVQDCNVQSVITESVSSTSVYIKAYSGIFPAANINIDSIVSANSTGNVNVALAVATTNSIDANAGDVTKFVTVNSVNCELSGSAVQIIAEKDDQLQNITVNSINGSVRDSALDIRLNGKRVYNFFFGIGSIDAAAAEYGVIVDGGGSAFNRYISDNIRIQSYAYSDRSDSTQDIVLTDVEGVTVGYVAAIANNLGATDGYAPPVVRTTNTVNCKIDNLDDSNVISVNDHMLLINGKLGGSASTLTVNSVTGDDDNNGKSAYPLKTIGRAIKLIPDVCNSDLTLNVSSGTYAENPRLIAKTFNGATNFNFNGASVGNFDIFNVQSRPTRFNINTLNCSSSSTDNIRVENSHGLTLDGYVSSGSGVASLTARGSSFTVKNSNLGSSNMLAIAAYFGSNVYSENNTGNGTTNGLFARSGAVIAKSGTQPTGTSANESTGSGGEIR